MKITAAVVSSGFSNVPDSVFFCLPDCEDKLSRYLGDYRFDWAEIDLPQIINDAAEEMLNRFGGPEYFLLIV